MGGPGYLEKALKSIKNYIIGWFIAGGLLLVGLGWWLSHTFPNNQLYVFGAMAITWLLISTIIGIIVARAVSRPLKALSEAIMHVSPSPLPIPAPDIEKLSLAKELVANLTRQVYDYAAKSSGAGLEQNPAPMAMTIQQLPVSVMGIDREGKIIFANPKAQEYAHTTESLVGKNIYSQFDLMFRDDLTLQDWVEQSRATAATAQKIWHGVRMSAFDQQSQFCDLAASYVKQAGPGTAEVILTAFDETDSYGAEDESLSFVALAVHELRTPLTILKGYIEVFEDELGKTLTPEMQDFMQKMQAAAENLTAFVGNILNVARIEQNQLMLKLTEENWKETITAIISNMQLRAKVHGKIIKLSVPDGLPTVGIDKVSIAEVMINLLDNAIKYSPKDKKLIKVSVALTKDNVVETTIEDFGVGIPATVVPHLFEKYSRNHRNRTSISGTGLGLYLSKALVAAHGGNIWVRSKEGQGTVFGFTVLPYAQLADKDKSGDNNITRSAHGWIKNHSLSRQ